MVLTSESKFTASPSPSPAAWRSRKNRQCQQMSTRCPCTLVISDALWHISNEVGPCADLAGALGQNGGNYWLFTPEKTRRKHVWDMTCITNSTKPFNDQHKGRYRFNVHREYKNMKYVPLEVCEWRPNERRKDFLSVKTHLRNRCFTRKTNLPVSEGQLTSLLPSSWLMWKPSHSSAASTLSFNSLCEDWGNGAKREKWRLEGWSVNPPLFLPVSHLLRVVHSHECKWSAWQLGYKD